MILFRPTPIIPTGDKLYVITPATQTVILKNRKFKIEDLAPAEFLVDPYTNEKTVTVYNVKNTSFAIPLSDTDLLFGCRDRNDFWECFSFDIKYYYHKDYWKGKPVAMHASRLCLKKDLQTWVTCSEPIPTEKLSLLTYVQGWYYFPELLIENSFRLFLRGNPANVLRETGFELKRSGDSLIIAREIAKIDDPVRRFEASFRVDF